jgi:hypothetical protein
MTAVAAMLLVYGSSSEMARMTKAERKTQTALEYARHALIGRAIGDTNRPGSFPCPDGDNDGSADLFAGSACPSYIGRLPWRTLGIGDLRDASGERLWYALSPTFRDHPAAPPLNSDTAGSLIVYSGTGTTTIARDAVAIVFAAGSTLSTQARDDSTAQCETTGKHIPRSRCPTNYLDTLSGFSNAGGSGPYIAASPGELYNDRLAIIVAADFMPQVEQRVAMELRNALLAYKTGTTCRCYPWATNAITGANDAGQNRGRIPVRDVLPEPWPAGALPAYFAANNWDRVIYYAIARTALENSGKDCATCAEQNLTIDRSAGHEVVLITPGLPVNGTARTTSADYLEDAENRNGDDRYVTPASRDSTRNHMHAITSGIAGCAANARVLLHNAPCGGPGGVLRTACQSAGKALEGCSCAAAAGALLKTPCLNILGGSTCESAFTQLQACTS